jgi:hypothetical protein
VVVPHCLSVDLDRSGSHADQLRATIWACLSDTVATAAAARLRLLIRCCNQSIRLLSKPLKRCLGCRLHLDRPEVQRGDDCRQISAPTGASS